MNVSNQITVLYYPCYRYQCCHCSDYTQYFLMTQKNYPGKQALSADGIRIISYLNHDVLEVGSGS